MSTSPDNINMETDKTSVSQPHQSTLSEALTLARKHLPLPREILLNQKRVHYNWLIAHLTRAKTEQDLFKMAFKLEFRDIPMLFPTLSTLTNPELIDKLSYIIYCRASRFLYLQGWLTLQFAYPRNTVAKVLTELCHQINLREEYEPQNSATAPQLKDMILWSKTPLISQISPPNSRTFISDIIKYIQKNDLSLSNFFATYAIYADLALGTAIETLYDATNVQSKERELELPNNLLRSLGMR